MKHTLLIFLFFIFLNGFSQTYQPNLSGITTNTPLAPGQAIPTDSRSMFYDPVYFKWRPYVSTTEVLTYLNLAKYREGKFDIIVNTGGTLSGGVITGGVNHIYFFKNGTANSDLVLKGNISSVNGQTGVVVVKNADSLRTMPFDTANNVDGYVVTFDKVNRKFFLSSKGGGANYTAGTGIDITSGVLSALNTQSIWNANQLRGRPVSGIAPTLGQVLRWDGLGYTPSTPVAFDEVLYDNDTLYFVNGTDTSKTFFEVSVPGDNWGFQTAAVQAPLFGDGVNPIGVDTTSSLGLATKSDAAYLQNQINAIGPISGGGSTTRLINTALPDSLSRKINDSTYRLLALVPGANVSFSLQGDTALVLNSTPGTAEINTKGFTLTTTGNNTVSVESMVDYILVKPTANLTDFKVGVVSDDDLFIPSTPVFATGEYIILDAPFYLPSSTAIYFSGITSSTDIQIVFKPLHR